MKLFQNEKNSEKGNVIRRNRCHLLPTNETFQDSIGDSYEGESLLTNEVPDGNTGVIDDSATDNSSNNESGVDAANDGNDGEYVTRYGRICREPDRFGY